MRSHRAARSSSLVAIGRRDSCEAESGALAPIRRIYALLGSPLIAL